MIVAVILYKCSDLEGDFPTNKKMHSAFLTIKKTEKVQSKTKQIGKFPDYERKK